MPTTPTIIAAAVMLMPAFALASPDLERPSGSLLEGLDGLLDGLPPDAPPLDPEAPLDPDAPQPNQDAVPLEGEDLAPPPESPQARLAKIRDGMDRARRLIQQAVATGKASGVQQQVVTELDALIKQAEQNSKKRSSQSSGSPASQPQNQGERQASQRSQPKPGEPGPQGSRDKGAQQTPGQGPKPGAPDPSRQANAEGNKSTGRLEAARAAAAQGRPAGELMKEVWGRLPQRVRERMLESSTDEFLPEYRDDIEQYFRQLAEQPE